MLVFLVLRKQDTWGLAKLIGEPQVPMKEPPERKKKKKACHLSPHTHTHTDKELPVLCLYPVFGTLGKACAAFLLWCVCGGLLQFPL